MPTRKSTASSSSSSTAAAAARPKGRSLHVGLNAVDPAHYGGWSGDLVACEFDAHDMAAIARSQGLKPTTLLTVKATRGATLAALRSAAKALKAGDLFVLSYSGHGGQVPDTTGDEQDDKQDETWCLYDGQLIDDELYFELSRFVAGVRILVLSDSCHSGTVVRAQPPQVVMPGMLPQRPKLMPRSVALRVYRDHQAFYDGLQEAVLKAVGKAAVDPDVALANIAVSPRLTALVKKFRATAVLISGCQDNQTSMDGDHNGAFTEQLLSVWNNGTFNGSHALFHAQIRARLPASQSPNLFTLGQAGMMLAQRPFSVAAKDGSAARTPPT